jgi:hypothetical protein
MTRSEEVLEKEANKLEALIPITIDFDVPNPNPDLAGIKIKDRFLWNLNGQFPRDSMVRLLMVQKSTLHHINSRRLSAKIPGSQSTPMLEQSRT